MPTIGPDETSVWFDSEWSTASGAGGHELDRVVLFATTTTADQTVAADEQVATPNGTIYAAGATIPAGTMLPAGTITEYTTPTYSPFGNLGGITVGPDGNIWVTDIAGGTIGKIERLTLSDTTLTSDTTVPDTPRFSCPRVPPCRESRGRSTSRPALIGSGARSSTAAPSCQAGRSSPRVRCSPPGHIPSFASPPLGASPTPSPLPRTAHSGTASALAPGLGELNPSDGTVFQPVLPGVGSYVVSFAADSQGNLWFSELIGGKVGRINSDGTINEFPAPGGPGGITVAPDGSIVYTEYLANKVSRIQPGTFPLTSPLPTITVPVTLDGSPVRGLATEPQVELNGSGAGAAASGLTLGAGSSGSVISGLAIDQFAQDAIVLEDSTIDVIQGNDLSDNGAGIVIAGTSASDDVGDNTFSGNTAPM